MVTASLVDFESTGDWPFFGMKIINIKKNYFDLRIFYTGNNAIQLADEVNKALAGKNGVVKIQGI
jgi:hypothetical protein